MCLRRQPAVRSLFHLSKEGMAVLWVSAELELAIVLGVYCRTESSLLQDSMYVNGL